MIRHPAKSELMAFAERLVDKRGPIPARVAAHIKACSECRAEIQAMRSSLAFVDQAADLDVSCAFSVQLNLAVRAQREAMRKRRNRCRSVVAMTKGLAYVAGVVITATLCYGAALSGQTPAQALPNALQARAPFAGPSPEAIRKAAVEIETLAAAVTYPAKRPRSLWEREYRRAVITFNDDLGAAAAALERNPGCARARNLIQTCMKRQADTLRTLYVERTL
jgi:hypothetical protein